jgi:hypothetical protein
MNHAVHRTIVFGKFGPWSQAEFSFLIITGWILPGQMEDQASKISEEQRKEMLAWSTVYNTRWFLLIRDE